MKRILLLDGYFVQAYSVSKSLRLSGFEVTLLTSEVVSYGFFSRYPHKRILSPKSDDVKFNSFLIKLLEKEHYDVIIPLCNEGAEYLSKHYVELKKYGVALAVMPWDVFEKAHNKEKLMEVCKIHGLPHPRTMKLSRENISAAVDYVGFPALIKPNFSVGARGITMVRNVSELQKKYETILLEYSNSTLQEFVKSSGSYYNVMLYRTREGTVKAYTIIEIKRFFPIKGGSSCFCVTIENQDLLKICSETLEVLHWEGFADFDVMQDDDTGEYRILEINPRIPASIEAAFVSGINFPELIVSDLLGLELKQYTYTPGKMLRFLVLDFMWFVTSPKRFSFRPSFFHFVDKGLYYQDASLKDPLLLLIGLITGLRRIFNIKYLRSKFCS